MKVLVKIGGTLLDDASSRQEIANELSAIAREVELVVVHGGGKQVTQFLADRGVTTQFVGGLRVSDEAVVDAVTKVIAGGVNKQLVAALIRASELPVGISGIDGSLTRAAQLDPKLGFVGAPENTDPKLLDLLVAAGYLPVIACIAADRLGNVYNVNADQMAVSCALGWCASKLIFLTDVDGVKDARGAVLHHLDQDEMTGLIESGVAHGGMKAKLDAASAALRAGLYETIIAQGREPRVCQRLLAGEVLGTRLSLRSVAARELGHG